MQHLVSTLIWTPLYYFYPMYCKVYHHLLHFCCTGTQFCNDQCQEKLQSKLLPSCWNVVCIRRRGPDFSRKSKVSNFHHVRSSGQNIFGFEVTMEESKTMHVCQALQQIKKDDKSKIGEREAEGKQLKNLGCAVSKRLHFEDQSEKAIWPLVHRSRNNKENSSIIKEEISCQTKKYDTSLGPLGKYYNCSYSSDYTFRRKYQNTDSQNTQTSPTLRSILGTPW